MCKGFMKGIGLYSVVGVSEAGCGPGVTVDQQCHSGEEKVDMRISKDKLAPSGTHLPPPS